MVAPVRVSENTGEQEHRSVMPTGGFGIVRCKTNRRGDIQYFLCKRYGHIAVSLRT